MLLIKQLLCSYLQSHLFLLHQIEPNLRLRNTSTSSCWCHFFFSSKTSFRLMEVAQRDFYTSRAWGVLAFYFISKEQGSSILQEVHCLMSLVLSQSRNKTKSQPHESVSSYFTVWPCQLLPVPEVFFSKKDAEEKKKTKSANVSKFEVRCQLLALVVKISSLCICKAVCMALDKPQFICSSWQPCEVVSIIYLQAEWPIQGHTAILMPFSKFFSILLIIEDAC